MLPSVCWRVAVDQFEVWVGVLVLTAPSWGQGRRGYITIATTSSTCVTATTSYEILLPDPERTAAAPREERCGSPRGSLRLPERSSAAPREERCGSPRGALRLPERSAAAPREERCGSPRGALRLPERSAAAPREEC